MLLFLWHALLLVFECNKVIRGVMATIKCVFTSSFFENEISPFLLIASIIIFRNIELF